MERCRHGARILPAIAAVGGMAIPALIFVLVNREITEHLAGWAIPAATDIAFAMGVLAILGSKVPLAIRVLLVGITIIDDLLAIVGIALFYTSELQLAWPGAAGIAIVAFAQPVYRLLTGALYRDWPCALVLRL